MKVTLFEGEGVAIFVVLSVMGKRDNSRLTLLVLRILGMFKIWFDEIVNVKRINKVPVIFSNLYQYFA